MEAMVKTNKPFIFTISFELGTLFQKLVQKVVEKKHKYKSILHNSTEESIAWTSEKD